MVEKMIGYSIALIVFVAGGLIVTPEAKAAGCEVTVESTDAMSFSTKVIEIKKSCKDFTINLKHVGTMPKNVMGHNLVITKASDQTPVSSDGSAAGADNHYVKPADARVIASTKLIGGGESASVKLPVSKLNSKDSYVFFCSFPGHGFMMKGEVKLI
jgi:azurin